MVMFDINQKQKYVWESTEVFFCWQVTALFLLDSRFQPFIWSLNGVRASVLPHRMITAVTMAGLSSGMLRKIVHTVRSCYRLLQAKWLKWISNSWMNRRWANGWKIRGLTGYSHHTRRRVNIIWWISVAPITIRFQLMKAFSFFATSWGWG